jgi:hypothetical protein
MRCERKDSDTEAGLNSEQHEIYVSTYQDKNRALIHDHFTEGFTPNKHANKQMSVKGT